MNKKIISLLRENARISVAEIANRLDSTEDDIANKIKELEDNGVIKGYTAIINEELIEDAKVKAMIYIKTQPEREKGFDHIASRLSKFPEVISLYLGSGDFDLILEIHGKTLQDVGYFVSSKLATMEGVVSTQTHFLLKKYKELGKLLTEEEKYERLKITP